MRKLFLYLVFVMLMMNGVYALRFKVNILGYTIEYNPPHEIDVVNEIAQPVLSETHEFDDYANAFNKIPEATKALADLGYKTIGFTDIVTKQRYVIIVNQGLIKSVYKSYEMSADAELSGNLERIKQYIYARDYMGIRQEIQIPLKVKLHIIKIILK